MNQNINKEFEDLAWDKMRTLLDQDLPEGGVLIPPQSETLNLTKTEGKKLDITHKPKKNLWFIALLLLLIGGSSSFAWQYFNKGKVISIQETIVEKPVVNTENSAEKTKNTEGGYQMNTEPTIANFNKEKSSKINKNFDKTLENTFHHKISIENKNTQNIDNEIVNADISPSNKNNRGINNSEISSILAPISETKDKHIADNNSISTNEIATIIPPQYNLQNTIIEPQNNKPDSIRSIQVVEALPSIAHFISESKDSNVQQVLQAPICFIPLNDKTIIPIIYSKKLNWGITTGAHSEGGTRIDGYQAGVFFSKKLSSKWAFNSELNYRLNSTKGDSVTFIQLQAVASTATSTTNTGFNLLQGTEIHLKNIHYIEMPLSVSYQINQKWAVFTGIKAAYLLNKTIIAQDGTKWYLVNTTSADTRLLGAQKTSLVTNTTTSALGLSRWDGAILGGIAYTISPKLVVSARYDFIFKNILVKQKWEAYNQYIGVNVQYSFR